MRFVVLPGTRSAGLFSRRPAGTECGGLLAPAAARVEPKTGDGLTRRRGGAENVQEIVTTGDHPSGECRAISRRVSFWGILRVSAPPREISKAPFRLRAREVISERLIFPLITQMAQGFVQAAIFIWCVGNRWFGGFFRSC